MDQSSVRTIQGYQLEKLIGEGAYGAVYRARQEAVEREVAIKIILPEFANRPEFIRRFETEAQLVAQLEHIHIVPLYDYWRDPDGAYLVMRLMKGGSLQNLIDKGPIHLSQAASLFDQIGSALAAAHRRGIIHRDLKPANILLDEDGNAYLSDFGIAKALSEDADLTVTGAILGTPAFITPEQVKSLPVSPQTDIYSLGVLLYTILTGKHPFQDASPGDLMVKHVTTPLPSVTISQPEIPPEVDLVIQKATAKDPAERYRDVDSFLADFHQVLGPSLATPPAKPLIDQILEISNPYKGLRPFLEADAADFFGRDELTSQLLTRMEDSSQFSRFLAVVGPSGSGKSSLVKAGLLPALRQGAVHGSQDWFMVTMTPASRPLDELEVSLLRLAAEKPPDLMGQLQRDGNGLLRATQLVLPTEDAQLLLVVDQFEELFTLTQDAKQARHFMDLIYKAVTDAHSQVQVIITLRADFYDRPLMEPDFSALVQKRTEVVVPLTTDELNRAVCGPAERVGVSLEPGLETEIMADVIDQPGSLPLLQYALTELFDHRQGRLLTRKAYQSIDGVLGALGRRANEVYQGLAEFEQALSRQVFLRLISLGEGVEDTRRRVLRSELTAIDLPAVNPSPGEMTVSVDQVLESYGTARLLSFDHDPQTRAPTVEVAHEALLREWDQLKAWLDESRNEIHLQRMLGAAAQDWLTSNQDPSFLLRGARLAQFESWAQETSLALTGDEKRYLQASLEDEAQRKAQREKLERRSRNFLRALVGVFAVAAVVAIGLSIFAFQQRQSAQRQAGILLASQAESEIEAGNTDRAILLALEALENYPYTSQAEHALGQAVTDNRALQLYEGHTAAVTGAAWSSDGKKVATSSTDNTVHVWDSSSGELEHIINLPEGITGNIYDWGLTVKWSPDDRYLLTISGDRFLSGGQDYDLILWDVSTFEQVEIVDAANNTEPLAGESASWFYHYPTGAGAAFTPDGRLVTLGGDNTAIIWDQLLEQQRLVLKGHTGGVNSVDWSPDLTKLATASEDGTAIVWDAKNGEALLHLAGYITGGINQVAWSPDGNSLATAGDDGFIQIWNANTAGNLSSIGVGSATGSNDEDDLIVWSLAWSPDGDYLATGGGDGYIRLWDVNTGQNLAAMRGHENFVSYLAWSPVDERLLSTGADGVVRIWKTDLDNMLFSIPYGYVSEGEWSPDGKEFIISSDVIAVWDLQKQLPILETSLGKDTSWLWGAFYSPDGNYILARTVHDWPDTTDANKFWLLDSQTGETLRMLETDQDVILLEAGWSPDGKLVAAGDWEGKIYFWEPNTGNRIKEIQCLAWSHMVRWSPDGSRIAVLCLDFDAGITQIRIFDAENYQNLITFEGDLYSDPFQYFSWSPDSKLIAVAGGSDEVGTKENPVYVFNAITGDELIKIIRHSGHVWGVNWSPNGERIVSGSTDDTTRVWDAETGAELLTLSTPTDWASLPAWSPDGRYLLTAMGSNEIQTRSGVWRVWQTTEDLIKYAKECCVYRELTTEEREQFGLPQKQ